MDLLLNEGISTALHFIEKRGEFYPFGVVKTKFGEIRHVQVLGEATSATPNSASDSLRTSLKKGGAAGDYETVAVVSLVDLTDRETGDRQDAISIEIDDKASNPILCYALYKMQNGSPVIGDIKAGVGKRLAFAR
jgi:hypothetical protein